MCIQACALYILRSAVIEALAEPGQKALLQQLVGLLMRPGCAVPTAVVALEGEWGAFCGALGGVVIDLHVRDVRGKTFAPCAPEHR